MAAAQKAGRKGKKRTYIEIDEEIEANDEIEAINDAGEGLATINSSLSTRHSIHTSKRVRCRTYKANC